MSKRILIPIAIINIAEALLFIFIAIYSIDGSLWQNGVFRTNALMERLLPQVGNLSIVIVTTWYVVLTYFMLLGQEKTIKRESEPFLSITWMLASGEGSIILPDADQLSSRVIEELSRIVGNYETLPTNEKEYITVEIVNVRSIPVKQIDIELQISIQTEGFSLQVDPINSNWEEDNLDLKTWQRKRIAVVEVNSIPNFASVSVSVKTINYSPLDSQKSFNTYAGDATYKYKCHRALRVTALLEPRVEGGGR